MGGGGGPAEGRGGGGERGEEEQEQGLQQEPLALHQQLHQNQHQQQHQRQDQYQHQHQQQHQHQHQHQPQHQHQHQHQQQEQQELPFETSSSTAAAPVMGGETLSAPGPAISDVPPTLAAHSAPSVTCTTGPSLCGHPSTPPSQLSGQPGAQQPGQLSSHKALMEAQSLLQALGESTGVPAGPPLGQSLGPSLGHIMGPPFEHLVGPSLGNSLGQRLKFTSSLSVPGRASPSGARVQCPRSHTLPTSHAGLSPVPPSAAAAAAAACARVPPIPASGGAQGHTRAASPEGAGMQGAYQSSETQAQGHSAPSTRPGCAPLASQPPSASRNREGLGT